MTARFLLACLAFLVSLISASASESPRNTSTTTISIKELDTFQQIFKSHRLLQDQIHYAKTPEEKLRWQQDLVDLYAEIFLYHTESLPGWIDYFMVASAGAKEHTLRHHLAAKDFRDRQEFALYLNDLLGDLTTLNELAREYQMAISNEDIVSLLEEAKPKLELNAKHLCKILKTMVNYLQTTRRISKQTLQDKIAHLYEQIGFLELFSSS